MSNENNEKVRIHDLQQKMNAVIGCCANELKSEIEKNSFSTKACEILILKELLQEQNTNENTNTAASKTR